MVGVSTILAAGGTTVGLGVRSKHQKGDQEFAVLVAGKKYTNTVGRDVAASRKK